MEKHYTSEVSLQLLKTGVSLFILTLVGCSPPTEPVSSTSASQAEEKLALQRTIIAMEAYHQCKLVSPEAVGVEATTYEIQQFLRSSANGRFAFQVRLNDVYEAGEKIFAAFECPFDDLSFMQERTIILRLEVNSESADALVKKLHSYDAPRYLRGLSAGDLYVVATINGFQRDWSAAGASAEESGGAVDGRIQWAASGALVACIPVEVH